MSNTYFDHSLDPVCHSCISTTFHTHQHYFPYPSALLSIPISTTFHTHHNSQTANSQYFNSNFNSNVITTNNDNCSISEYNWVHTTAATHFKNRVQCIQLKPTAWLHMATLQQIEHADYSLVQSLVLCLKTSERNKENDIHVIFCSGKKN